MFTQNYVDAREFSPRSLNLRDSLRKYRDCVDCKQYTFGQYTPGEPYIWAQN